jgi:hypothetical protein
MGSRRLAPRLAALVLVISCLGLPIDDLVAYAIMVAAALVILTGSMATSRRRWASAAAVAALVIVVHALWPAPRIDEGDNVFLPGPTVATSSGLPADVLRVALAQFAREYPPEKRCDDPARGCWRPDRTAAADGFAFSADAPLAWPVWSRRVTGIDFTDPAYLRLGFINDAIYNWPDNASDVKRFERDRRSLNLFDRYRVTFPLFVAFRFPAAFAGSTLCWRGTVLWEEEPDRFAPLSETACREIATADAGRRVYALSIRRDVRLAMTLKPSVAILLRRGLETGAAVAGAIAILLLLVRVDRARLALSALLVGLALVAVVFVDAAFIGSFRPLDSGDDGIIYEGYGRIILRHLIAGDAMVALAGEEPVYYFTPGFRYVRTLELALFGDTFLLYLSAMLALAVLAFAAFRRFLQPRWTLVLALGFIATPVGALYGSSLFQYVEWASRGFADPFAFVLLLGGILAIVPPAGEDAPSLPRILAGGLLLSAATFCRPNLVLAAGALVAGAAAIFMAQRRLDRVAVLAAGFATLALSPLHNLVFGHAFVLFSDNVNQPQTLLMSPLDYARAAYELVTLSWGEPYLARALAQLGRWLSGPQHLLAMVPIHAAAIAILVRVGLFGRGFDPWLRVVALATLLQHGIGVSYVDYQRYTLGTWFLTLVVTAAWLEREGVALLWWTFPRLCESWRRHAVVRRIAAIIALGAVRFRLDAPPEPEPTRGGDYDRTLHHEHSR